MARKPKYKPQSFESSAKNAKQDHSANIFHTMLVSDSFMDLTKNQRLLYVYMKDQYFTGGKPYKDYPDIEEIQAKPNEYFYFPWKHAVDMGLYKQGNKHGFYTDIKALESHGLIEIFIHGENRYQKSVYKYSCKWSKWKNPRVEKSLPLKRFSGREKSTTKTEIKNSSGRENSPTKKIVKVNFGK